MSIRKGNKNKSTSKSKSTNTVRSKSKRINKSNGIKLKRSQVPFLKEMFPDYKGRRITLKRKEEYSINSTDLFWSGGWKTKIGSVDIHGNINTSINDKVNFINPLTTTHERMVFTIPDDTAIVELQYAGREKWVNIYVSPDSKISPDSPKLLE